MCVTKRSGHNPRGTESNARRMTDYLEPVSVAKVPTPVFDVVHDILDNGHSSRARTGSLAPPKAYGWSYESCQPSNLRLVTQ